MRIAIFGIKKLPAVAGADRVVERVLEHYPTGHDVTVYLIRDGDATLTCTADRHYVYVPALKGKHTRAFSYFFLSCLHFLVKGRAEAAHVQHSDFGLFSALLKLKRGVRIVGTFHGNPYERQKWGPVAKAFLRLSEWFFVRCCDALTSVSPTKTVPGRVVTYVPNGVEPWSPSGEPSAFPYDELGLTKGEYVMFACGRLDSTKGLHHLLRAYKTLERRQRLLVVGDFTHDARYSQEIDLLAAEDERVILCKRLLDRETLFDVLWNADVFVFPSEIEAMSMVLLEAIACRKTTVCSDIAENIAVVGERYPYLFHSGDASSLAAVLTRALDATGRADDDAIPFDEIARRFRWDEIAREYVALLSGSATTPESAR
jgi:glycosyltransferase involved in cell wall biosynthesis